MRSSLAFESHAQSILALAFCLSSCSIYDPPEEAGHHGTLYLELEDTCNPMAEPYLPIDDHVLVELHGLESDVGAVPSCGVTGLDGPDGFVKLHMGAGERWHLVAEPGPEADVAMYLFEGTCDPRAADCRLIADRCPAGVEEEMTLTFPVARTLFLGFDTHGSDAEIEAEIFRTRCGDGTHEHGEVCDDGNLFDADGCDSKCRIELAETRNAEKEPNDVHGEANVIYPVNGLSLDVSGEVGGLCDQDHFAIALEVGEELSVEMLAADGSACPSGNPDMRLMVMDTARGVPVAQQAGSCPTLTTTVTSDGEYHIMLIAAETGKGVARVPYTLRMRVSSPI